jgi:hypothetical protein
LPNDSSQALGDLLTARILLSPQAENPSSLALFRAVSEICGADGWEPLPGQVALREGIDPAGHIVFVIVDGLGMNLRADWPEGGFFERYYRRELRAIFPSTTAAVLSSHATCLWPADHGIPGWFAYLPDRGITIRPLIFDNVAGEIPLARLGLTPGDVIQGTPVPTRYNRPTCSFLPARLKATAYSTWARGETAAQGYQSPEDAVLQLATWLEQQTGPAHAYLYLPEVDKLGHSHGWKDSAVHEALRKADRALWDLSERLKGRATIVATADHGQIVVPGEKAHKLEEGDVLLEHLLVPPTGEPRTPVLHVRSGHDAAFRQMFVERYGEDFLLVPTETVEEHGLFGPIPLGAVMRARLGDYVAIARGAAALEYVPSGGQSPGFVGFHGGLTGEEMRVPLFVT